MMAMFETTVQAFAGHTQSVFRLRDSEEANATEVTIETIGLQMNYRSKLFSCNRHRKHSGYRATAAQNTVARRGCFRGCFTLVLFAKFFSSVFDNTTTFNTTCTRWFLVVNTPPFTLQLAAVSSHASTKGWFFLW